LEENAPLFKENVVMGKISNSISACHLLPQSTTVDLYNTVLDYQLFCISHTNSQLQC